MFLFGMNVVNPSILFSRLRALIPFSVHTPSSRVRSPRVHRTSERELSASTVSSYIKRSGSGSLWNCLDSLIENVRGGEISSSGPLSLLSLTIRRVGASHPQHEHKITSSLNQPSQSPVSNSLRCSYR